MSIARFRVVDAPRTRRAPAVFTVGGRDLVLLAGLPGAGKSELLRRATVPPYVTVLDSDQIRRPLRDALGPVPYRLYRPIVHIAHHARLVWHALTAPGAVIVHEPATRVSTRVWIAVLRILTHRPGIFVWLDVSAVEALAGQHSRGRVLPTESFAKHVRRAAGIRRRLRAGHTFPGWRKVCVLRRHDIDERVRVEFRLPATLRPD
ncbi:AAA family ATPase [Allokutzneria albata]|uniref:AAA domain-containing protein n=1 Tax=Allokutzneria albata TaxID=211114 RepID=A0A1G9XF20_ALLAB|nr:AAA family ATPase [Allokutzneria albata]SDM94865.1 AAA domain-containing protein [Allokutzneria albata]